jgi:predicted PhzF superfamily epimerase YddE/YHI9
VGTIRIDTIVRPDGELSAAFSSVEPKVRDFDPGVLEHLLRLLGLTSSDLHIRYPAREAFAGNWHPVLVLAHVEDFDRFHSDPTSMRSFMQDHNDDGDGDQRSWVPPWNNELAARNGRAYLTRQRRDSDDGVRDGRRGQLELDRGR